MAPPRIPSDTTPEEWRPVLDCKKYQISNLGNIIGPSGKVLKAIEGRNGYNQIVLSLGDRQTSRRYIHRLVVEAFLGEIPSDCVVNHKDHNKRNNKLANLEIANRKANAKHWARKGRVKGRPERPSQDKCPIHKTPYSTSDSRGAFCEACRTEKLLRKKLGIHLIPPSNTTWRESGVAGYLVSRDGRIWSCKTERILSQGVNGVGYAYVNIGGKNHAIHLLVAESFVRKINAGEIVDHADHDKLNNSLDNLQILSRSQNTNAFWNQKKMQPGKTNSIQRLTDEDALSIIELGANGLSQNELARRYKVARSTIQDILSRRRFKHLDKNLSNES